MNSTPSVESVARRVIRELRARRNPARAATTQKYFKDPIPALGIDTQTMRQYGRDQLRQLKPVWLIRQATDLCGRLLLEPEVELRGLGILILGGFQPELSPRLLPEAKRWLRTRLDNWALVDGFCVSVLTPLLDRHPSFEATLRNWSKDRCLWVRRAALVTLVPFARRGRYLELSYDLAREHFGDPEDLMHKATGWLLREAGKKDMRRLQDFLLRHGPDIPRTALRYAIERFPAGERTRLLRQTRADALPTRKTNHATVIAL